MIATLGGAGIRRIGIRPDAGFPAQITLSCSGSLRPPAFCKLTDACLLRRSIQSRTIDGMSNSVRSELFPAVVASADWSKDPRKCWVACAVRRGTGQYEIMSCMSAGRSKDLFDRLSAIGQGGTLLVGFDFPIGLPCEYARKTAIPRFPDALQLFGKDQWSSFTSVRNTVRQPPATYRWTVS